MRELSEHAKNVIAALGFCLTLLLAFGAGAFLSLIRPLPEPILVDEQEPALVCPDTVNMIKGGEFCNWMQMEPGSLVVMV